jgi:glucose-1-phosphate thymidylyltransferase
VGCARDFVGNDSFVVYLGDDLMREGITELVHDFDRERFAAGIGLQEVENPTRYGIVDVDDGGNATQLEEKPDEPTSNLALIGVYVFTPAIFDHIETLEKSWRGEYEITEAIQSLLSSGERIQTHVVEGWWKDTGKPEDVLHANRLVLDDMVGEIEGTVEEGASVKGRVDLGQGSVINDGAVVRGPVSIGRDTTIDSTAYIGPYTSIGNNCVVRRAGIESTIVMGGCDVCTEQTIIDSIIGYGSNIKPRDSKPEGNSLIIGANSSLKF